MEVPGNWPHVILLTRGYKRRSRESHQEELLFSGRSSSMHLMFALVNAFDVYYSQCFQYIIELETIANAFDVHYPERIQRGPE